MQVYESQLNMYVVLDWGIGKVGAPGETDLEVPMWSGVYKENLPIYIFSQHQDMASESQGHHSDIPTRDRDMYDSGWEGFH